MPAIKEIIKYLAALGLYYLGLLYLHGILRRAMTKSPKYIILMYHRVLNDLNADDNFTQPGMSVSTEAFNEQVKYLKRKYELVSLAQLARLIESGTTIKQPMAVITFDDGWRDNYLNAFPILKRYEAPASVFLTTDHIGTSKPFWFLAIKWLLKEGSLTVGSMAEIVADMAGTSSSESGTLAELIHVIKTTRLDSDKIIEACKQLESGTLDTLIEAMLRRSRLSLDYWQNARPMMTWEEAAQMSRSKIEIGSHGCLHRILTLLPHQEIERELSESKKAIESRLGITVSGFSYPNGDFDGEIKKGVSEAGYLYAVATSRRPKQGNKIDLYELERVTVHEGITTGPRGRFSKAMFAWHIVRHS